MACSSRLEERVQELVRKLERVRRRVVQVGAVSGLVWHVEGVVLRGREEFASRLELVALGAVRSSRLVAYNGILLAGQDIDGTGESRCGSNTIELE